MIATAFPPGRIAPTVKILKGLRAVGMNLAANSGAEIDLHPVDMNPCDSRPVEIRPIWTLTDMDNRSC